MKNKLFAIFGIALCAVFFAGAAFADEESSLASYSWKKYNSGDYSEAYKGFKDLNGKKPANTEYALGLAYSAEKLGKLDEALEIAEKFENRKPDFKNIKHSILFTKGKAAYDKKDYKAAESYLQRLYDSGGADDGARELLGWSQYNQDKLDESLVHFQALYERTKAKRLADIILVIDGRKKEALGKKNGVGEELLKEASAGGAESFYALDFPITSAQTKPSPTACYNNADKPWIELGGSLRNKEGDEGTSKLTDQRTSLAFAYPFRTGNLLKFGVTFVDLDSGDAKPFTFLGRFVYSAAPFKRPFETSVKGYYPELSFKHEGNVSYSAGVGTTPFGAELSPAPTWFLKAETGFWKVEAHAESVEESLLSFTGINEPYFQTEEYWGRVVKTGITAERTFVIPKTSYWVHVNGDYHAYRGVNTIDNSSASAGLTLGKSIEESWGGASLGLFSTASGFKNNSSAFTYGHGGYFSPKKFFIVGGFLSLETKACKNVKADLALSVGKMSYTEEDAKRYPLSDATLPERIVPPFEGDNGSSTGFGVNGGIEALVLGNFILGARYELSKAADYTEWKAGLSLKYNFGKMNAVIR
ncbi:MAG: cellulose synthase subunit BcsC-related outer membrane protein [Deltaproteobacteria bacterium]|nr:cellulose synthase subunit BcsC-related outer membrane protein [Deltaproteobacteria bacterium]